VATYQSRRFWDYGEANSGTSNYHSLQTQITRRFAQGLQVRPEVDVGKARGRPEEVVVEGRVLLYSP